MINRLYQKRQVQRKMCICLLDVSIFYIKTFSVTSLKGVPLRAEGFPKRRCQFESVATQSHLNPRKKPWLVVRGS